MRNQHRLRTLSHAIGKKVCAFTRDLQHWWTERPQKLSALLGQNPERAPARDDHDRLMAALPARIANCASLRAVRRKLAEAKRRIAPETSECPGNTRRTREPAVKQRQPFDRAAIHRD